MTEKVQKACFQRRSPAFIDRSDQKGNISPRTKLPGVDSYVSQFGTVDVDPEHPKLGPYIPSMQRLLHENEALPHSAQLTKQAIYESLQEEGFTGSCSSVRAFIAGHRAGTKRQDNLRVGKHGDTQAWKQITDMLAWMTAEQSKDLLLWVAQAKAPMLPAVKAKRLLRVAGSVAPATACPNPGDIKRQAAHQWMHSILQGSISAKDIEETHAVIPELRPLLHLIRTGGLQVRNKALAVLGYQRGFSSRTVCGFLDISRRSYWTWVRTFQQGGTEALFARQVSGSRKFDNQAVKDAVFSTLHQSPASYGINRTSWKMDDLERTLREKGHPVCRAVIRRIIKETGYRWCKARVVLTSRDPQYRTKLEHIQNLLSRLLIFPQL